MPLAETVTVVNRSGKVVQTSKHLVNVFKEAKTVYLERRSDIKAGRKADRHKHQHSHRRRASDSEDDYSSKASSRRTSLHSESVPRQKATSKSHSHAHRHRPPRDKSGAAKRATKARHANNEESLSISGRTPSGRELVRRNTDGMIDNRVHYDRPPSVRSASLDDVDLSLAYGELPPPLPLRPKADVDELRNKVSKLQALLDEANCFQHTAVSMIESLQKNPEQLAAVGLALAEISKLASKMAPSALLSLKNIFPAVFALLLSSEFMIAAGVGVGVTIIAFGGYKIIKRIQKKRNSKMVEDVPSDIDELQEIRTDLSRVEMWRRGIAEAHTGSVATSVEGEFITPVASRQLIDEGKLRKSDLKSSKGTKQKKSNKEKSKRKSETHEDAKDDRSTVMEKGMALIRDPKGIKDLFKKDTKKADHNAV